MAVVMAVSTLGFDEEYAITPLEPTAMDLWPGRSLYSLKLVEVQPIRITLEQLVKRSFQNLLFVSSPSSFDVLKYLLVVVVQCQLPQLT